MRKELTAIGDQTIFASTNAAYMMLAWQRMLYFIQKTRGMYCICGFIYETIQNRFMIIDMICICLNGGMRLFEIDADAERILSPSVVTCGVEISS